MTAPAVKRVPRDEDAISSRSEIAEVQPLSVRRPVGEIAIASMARRRW